MDDVSEYAGDAPPLKMLNCRNQRPVAASWRSSITWLTAAPVPMSHAHVWSPLLPSALPRPAHLNQPAKLVTPPLSAASTGPSPASMRSTYDVAVPLSSASASVSARVQCTPCVAKRHC